MASTKDTKIMNVIRLKLRTMEPPPFIVPTNFEVETHTHDWYCMFTITKTIEFRKVDGYFATAIIYEFDLAMLNNLKVMKNVFLNELTDAGYFLYSRKNLFDTSSSVLRFAPCVSRNFKNNTIKFVLITEIFLPHSKSNEETEALLKLILNRLIMNYGSSAYIVFEPDSV